MPHKQWLFCPLLAWEWKAYTIRGIHGSGWFLAWWLGRLLDSLWTAYKRDSKERQSTLGNEGNTKQNLPPSWACANLTLASDLFFIKSFHLFCIPTTVSPPSSLLILSPDLPSTTPSISPPFPFRKLTFFKLIFSYDTFENYGSLHKFAWLLTFAASSAHLTFLKCP